MDFSLPVATGSIGRRSQLTVGARSLHETLGVKRDFSSWIKGRIEKYAFVEGEDFRVFTKSGENPLGGRATKEYCLSLDMAKELAMVENNERGRLVRRYFIECERKMTARLATREPKGYSTMKLMEALGQVEMLMDKTMRYYRSQMCPYVQTMTARAAFDDAGLQSHLLRQTYQDTYLAAEHLKLAIRHATFAHETARGLKRVLEVPGRIEFF